MAMGIGLGDKVIVPGISFAATANAVALTGATPVFVDIDPETFNLDLEAAKSQLGQNVRAVIPVDLFGLPISREELDNFARENQLEVLIDSSQSHLATSGAESSIESKFHATYSFYPTKNMTTGEGGMVVTNDDDLAQNVRMLRNQGMSSQYSYELVGLNNRMTDIAGAIGISQLTRLRKNTRKRREIASIYSSGLRDLSTVHIQKTPKETFHAYHQFTITVAEQRDRFREALESDGVPTRVYYPQPLNKIKPFLEESSSYDHNQL
jgi:dTDP-4-amino-4,6-dideoxygalactose transaminase